MKPLFTVHAGEYIVGSHIEKKFPRLNIWVPVKDTGIDLLVSNEANTNTVSLQVKTSRDFLTTHVREEFQKSLRSCGWWNLNRDKIKTSTDDYWIFLIVRSTTKNDFILIKPKELLDRLNTIHGQLSRIQTYLWVTEKGECWETRGLTVPDQRLIMDGQFSSNPSRDFKTHLEGWGPIADLDN